MTAIPLAFVAITLWSFLAYWGSELTGVPPLLTLAVAFSVSGGLSLFSPRGWRVSAATCDVGVAGIFGYHLFFFSALQHAPAVEANLINYLWPQAEDRRGVRK